MIAAALGQVVGMVNIFDEVPQWLKNTLEKDGDHRLKRHSIASVS